MKKINLQEFKSEQLSLSEKMNTKAGSGSTHSRRLSTSCSGPDRDFRPQDRD